MARLPALVDLLTKADGVREHKTINNIARAVREAGLIPASPVGHNAVHLSTADTALLLLAVSAVVPRGQAAETARQLASLRIMPGRSSRSNEGLFKKLCEAETFGAAVELLITNAPALLDAFVKWVDDAWANFPESARDVLFMPILQVEFSSSLTARIAMLFDRGQRDDGTIGPQPEFVCTYTHDVNLERGFYNLRRTDRQITVTLGLQTFLALHQVMFPDDNEIPPATFTAP